MLISSGSPRSLGHLRQTVAYAALDAALWLLLQDRATRQLFREALLDRYFPQTRFRYRPTAGPDALRDLDRQMLEEPAAVYHTRLNLTDEVETAVRSAVFKREVLRVYDHTCAISGLKLVSTGTSAVAPLLNACHIVPWAVSHDDTISNGLALCPNLHRAFDRNLFWVDEAYQVRMATSFAELGGQAYGIQQFEGVQLRLPALPEWHPGQENFKKQR
ncbi:HNH endonuclease [Hymenobacter wooponensis]|uniref:HNH nuclease domain-containing protein n=1 Tax=Hymenobacter wooponensis TaxID=1525360 RepID=A0A4Z0MGJ9_9BACT|nr:HNH endonuclease [Hymenobacter wooponensis]TGD78487.1 hypothetical protein EU557_20505 [Hymenobacter wooponensis]